MSAAGRHKVFQTRPLSDFLIKIITLQPLVESRLYIRLIATRGSMEVRAVVHGKRLEAGVTSGENLYGIEGLYSVAGKLGSSTPGSSCFMVHPR